MREGRRDHVHHSTTIVDVDWRIEGVGVLVHFGLTPAHRAFESGRLLCVVSYPFLQEVWREATHRGVLLDQSLFVGKVDIAGILLLWIYPTISDSDSYEVDIGFGCRVDDSARCEISLEALMSRNMESIPKYGMY